MYLFYVQATFVFISGDSVSTRCFAPQKPSYRLIRCQIASNGSNPVLCFPFAFISVDSVSNRALLPICLLICALLPVTSLSCEKGKRLEVQGARLEVQGARCKVARLEVQGARSQIHGCVARLEVQGARSQIHEVQGCKVTNTRGLK